MVNPNNYIQATRPRAYNIIIEWIYFRVYATWVRNPVGPIMVSCRIIQLKILLMLQSLWYPP